MLEGSIREYEMLREEIISIKKCITDYIGFTVGGAGAAAISFAIIAKSGSDPSVVAYSSVALSILVTCIASILFYKFTSHNRFAGYCKLLNHELNVSDSVRNADPLHSWEIVLEQLKLSDYHVDVIADLVDKTEIGDIDQRDDKKHLGRIILLFTGHNPPVDNNRHLKGVWLLIKAFCGTIKSTSWSFPPLPSALFAFLTFGFLFVAAAVSVAGPQPLSNAVYTYQVVLVVAIGQFLVWWVFAGKLYSLVSGSATVQGFFWRFLPVRARFLNSQYITPKYFDLKRLMKNVLPS